jgi:uncharacterized protein (DUF952 family)
MIRQIEPQARWYAAFKVGKFSEHAWVKKETHIHFLYENDMKRFYLYE